jgi:inner membrane protein
LPVLSGGALLSEFLAFGYAYWIGAAASALLIVLYSLAVLRSGMRTGIIAAALATIYTYLYVVLQLQNYSLLIGTAGLFIALGVVMYTTRNLDWSTREE